MEGREEHSDDDGDYDFEYATFIIEYKIFSCTTTTNKIL